jgi:hypothetical protein
MVSQDTLDIINYSKDIDIDFNLKLFLLFIMLVYSVFFVWLTFKWDKDKHYITLIKNFLIRLPMMTFIFFFPLLSIFLMREASWEIIYRFLVVFYSYSFIILLISAKLGMFEFAFELLGYKMSPKQMKLDKVKQKW